MLSHPPHPTHLHNANIVRTHLRKVLGQLIRCDRLCPLDGILCQGILFSLLQRSPHRNLRAYKMASSASKRLFKEYKALSSDPPEGITAGPVSEDDMFLWEALIQGPEGTPFEGGVFPAELRFPKDYPLAPPKMKFVTEMWHPNGMYRLLPMPPSRLFVSPYFVYGWKDPGKKEEEKRDDKGLKVSRKEKTLIRS